MVIIFSPYPNNTILIITYFPIYTQVIIQSRIREQGHRQIIRKELPALQEFYWGDSFWTDGFFVETVGEVSFDKIKDYIKNQ